MWRHALHPSKKSILRLQIFWWESREYNNIFIFVAVSFVAYIYILCSSFVAYIYILCCSFVAYVYILCCSFVAYVYKAHSVLIMTWTTRLHLTIRFSVKVHVTDDIDKYSSKDDIVQILESVQSWKASIWQNLLSPHIFLFIHADLYQLL